MAGVSVLSGSGDPSGDNTIRVRGINSITAETGPLVVIDGFIGGSLQSLNPADIASIEVLKTLQQQPYTVHAVPMVLSW